MRKILLWAGLSMLLLVAMAAPAVAQLDVGVEVGDWFKYETAVTYWESTMEFLPDGYIGPLTLAENQTNYILYEVTDITPDAAGDNVTFSITYNWKNGSETYGTTVETVSIANTGIFMIGANMTPGEMVSDEWDFLNTGTIYPARYIDETIDLVNPNATRETNVCNYSIDLFGGLYDYIFFWDKITGMRVYYENRGDVPEIDFGMGTPQPAYIYIVKWELVDSSVDGLLVPDLTGSLLLLAIMSITVPVALLHRRKKMGI
jgi:hypothetical protein